MFIDTDSFYIDINTFIDHDVLAIGNVHDCIIKELVILPNSKDAYIKIHSAITDTTVKLKIKGLICISYAGISDVQDYDINTDYDFRLSDASVERGDKYVSGIDSVLAQNSFPFSPKPEQEINNSISLDLYYINQEKITILCKSISYEAEEGEEPKWNALRPKRENIK